MLVKLPHDAAVNYLCSRILQVIDVNEIGWLFAARCLSHFLKMGTIHAYLQSPGTSPVSSPDITLMVDWA